MPTARASGPATSPFAAAASTLLGVALLGYEGQLVELEATAALAA